MLNPNKQISYFDMDQEEEIIPLGAAKILVVNGRWTFNNKDLKKCNFPITVVVENFIRGCAFAMPFKFHERKRSFSVIETKETVYANNHLKQYNYIFPPRLADHKAVNEMEFVKVGQHSQEIISYVRN